MVLSRASAIPQDPCITQGYISATPLIFCRQCLLDESPKVAMDASCPICQTVLAAPDSHQILTRYTNEGGIQEALDILPLITEEAYLTANPVARPARAYLTMVGEGDVGGIVELLADVQDDAELGDMSPSEILRYQDPLDGNKTAMHVALEKHQQEVAWLLLWLGSGLDDTAFPDEVVAAAYSLGAGRELATAGQDIRGFRDEQERLPGDVAREVGGWDILLALGIL
jgi:hypothetical protein